ncbi:hypothetical protein Rhopal_006978-T1 [Rhodotorula paludigena]|uniref:Chitin deacetylase n=1 Tax=Rhodotorula paludigena TaxID=86838 RepID=A0AAV5GXN1_9BASI|nr:hypothetical protein Rhopal_006978-T1 [Rhodotorula paludigena]
MPARPRMRTRSLALSLVLLAAGASAQLSTGANGGEGGPGASARAQPQDVPQFVTFTADDAIQSYTVEVINHFLAERRNPNGCAPKMTYFTSLSYTNYSMVTEMYVAGNEIADHTMTHAGKPNVSEINGNLRALNAFAGIPVSDIAGFRAPLLSWDGDTLRALHNASFTYDSSMTSASPANASNTDAYWPYTLDNGIANNCLEQPDICQGRLKLPGLWEIPMYSTFGESTSDIHLMDPWLEGRDADEVLGWLQQTFLQHYNGNRQPFGLYSHPIHLAINYPGVTNPDAIRNMLQTFLDWVQSHDNVWIVSNKQLLEWMRNPVTNEHIADVEGLGCGSPAVPEDENICNGIPVNMAGLLNRCDFAAFPWQTCYYCPATEPTPDDPVPSPREGDTRHTLPSDCQTAWFDPIANRCLCDSDNCAFTDETRPIGNYSTNLGGNTTGSGDSTGPVRAEATAPSKFNGGVPAAAWSGAALLVAALAAVVP